MDAQRNSSYFDRAGSSRTSEMSIEQVSSISIADSHRTYANFTADKTKVDYNSWAATEFHV